MTVERCGVEQSQGGREGNSFMSCSESLSVRSCDCRAVWCGAESGREGERGTAS